MDDIAFFDSSSYSHRGGIWPDAGRREKPNVTNVHSTVHDDVSTVSAPPDMDSSSLNSGDVDSEVKRSSSEGDVNVTTGPLPMSPQASHHSATLPLSRDPSPTPGPSHHHSLFHPREHHHTPVENPDLSAEAVLLEVQHPHLRHKTSSSSEKSKRRFLGIGRTSPSPPSGLGSRSHSHGPSPTPSLENLRMPSPEPPNNAIPPSHLHPTKSPTLSSQSSLLSTLKSRAGDRQALSNTAKETMRKWTVNWGGLKKDRDLSATSSANSQDGRDSKPRSTSHTMKSNYAEIRAAVDGRKEKERGSSEGPSAPISIPDGGHRERTGSVSSMHNPQGSSLSSSQESSMVLSSSAGWSADPWVDETPPELASQPPPAIDVDGTPVESEDVDGEGPAPAMTNFPPTLPQRPIQSQPPQGKTMTIPGIHARNRGEVMSMGYVPPSPPALEAKTGVSTTVYRLWKHSPVSQSAQLDGDGDAEHAGLHSPPVLTADGVHTSAEPTPTNTARPHGPPLPPRVPASLHPSSDSSGLSSASAALKSIASRDEESRSQDGEGVEASSSPAPASPKPPLPPRKIHAPA
jgi:hypothetical protein